MLEACLGFYGKARVWRMRNLWEIGVRMRYACLGFFGACAVLALGFKEQAMQGFAAILIWGASKQKKGLSSGAG
jgi:hypothetical protein